VTIATDYAAIARELRRIAPDAMLFGEEKAQADPGPEWNEVWVTSAGRVVGGVPTCSHCNNISWTLSGIELRRIVCSSCGSPKGRRGV
jgi:hypothetical protein